MKLSVIFDNKVFGSNFGSGTLAVTVLGYRNGNFEETDPSLTRRSRGTAIATPLYAAGL